MELRAFAEAVLFSADLETKLSSPGAFTDHSPGTALEGSVLPGRPAPLPLIARRPIPATPTPHGIQDERVRGAALHTFAHHELQALELMALALLRFPDAPAGFRMGLGHIIADEQRHFRLYQGRAERWGVAMGEVGVGHVFWSTVADIREVTGFLGALSLTYEQANLDFAAHWKPAFLAVDDPETADVLQAVYDDEIRHVAHGVRWFERLSGRLDFATYQATLALPLSPSRAKGPVFDRAARLAAGFPPAFVDEVEVYTSARGQAARVFSFDPFVEEQVAGREPKAGVRAIQGDLAALPLFLAAREDVVLAARPRAAHLLSLQRAGFSLCEFAAGMHHLEGRAIRELCPWGWSPVVAAAHGRDWDPGHALLYDKRWAFALRRGFADGESDPVLAPVSGAVCASLAEVLAQISVGGEWVAKAPLSSSGQHRMRLRHPLEPAAQAWLTRWLPAGSVVVEPWYERLVDLSAQVEVRDDQVDLVGLTRFWTAGSGAYRGAVIGPWTAGLDPDLARWAHGGVPGGRVSGLLRRAGQFVGAELQARGYRGPAGVDAMVVKIAGEPHLVPILEVNPRYTMGRVALAIRRQVRGVGAWLFLNRSQLKKAGHADGAALADAVSRIPVVLKDGGLLSGVVCTTDPEAAQAVLTVLTIGESLRESCAHAEYIGLTVPESA